MNTPASAMSPSTPTRTVAGAVSGPAAGLAAGADAAGAAGEGGAAGAAGGAAGAQASPSRTTSSEPLSHRARGLILSSSPRLGAVRRGPAHGPNFGARRESPWPPWRNRHESDVEAGRAGRAHHPTRGP